MSKASTSSAQADAPGWAPPASHDAAPPRAPLRDRLLPFVGPAVLFLIWDLVVRAGMIKAILLPSPADTLVAPR